MACSTWALRRDKIKARRSRADKNMEWTCIGIGRLADLDGGCLKDLEAFMGAGCFAGAAPLRAKCPFGFEIAALPRGDTG